MKNPPVALLIAILAISLVGVGMSLTVPLIAVRMEAAGFSAGANGLSTAMAGIATIFVSPLIPRLVRRLGVRRLLVTALALAIATLLALALVDNVYWWFPIRFAYSAALTILFVVSEYAVNALAPAERRGFWIGVYSTSLYIGFAAGPAILGLVGTEGRLPFYVATALFVVAGAPIVVASDRIPGFSDRSSAPILAMVSRAPVLMFGALLFGAVETGAMGLLPVHALRNSYDAATGALFVSIIAVGNIVFQVPIGLLSDRLDRDRFIAIIAALGLGGAAALVFLSASFVAFSIVLFVWGGIAGGLYMIGLAELGTRYKGADLASANAAFVMFYASGMLVGPPLLGRTLDASPAHGLFGGTAALFCIYLVLVGVMNMRRRSP